MKKKKFFSYLFLGLLAVGATGTVTSCKDYDDDINANTEQINTLKQNVSTLEAALTKAQQDLQTQISNATTECESKCAAARQELQNAINTKADASTVSALAQRVADLETDKAGKIAGLQAQLNTINEALEKLQNTLSTKVDQDAFNEAIKALQDKDTELQNSYNALSSSKADKTALETLSSTLNDAITSLKNTSATKAELQAVSDLANDLKDGKLDKTDFETYKTATDALISSLTTRVGNLEENSATKKALSDAVDALTQLITNNKTAIDKAIADIQTLTDTKADKTALTSAVENLQEQIDAVKTDYATKKQLQDEVAKLQEQITKNAGDITTINSTLATLRTDVDSKVSKSDFDTEIGKINSALDGKVNVTDFTEFKTAYEEASATYTAWKGGVDDQLADLKTTDGKIRTELGDSIKAVKVITNSLQTQIDALNLFTGEIGSTTFKDALNQLSNQVNGYTDQKFSALSDSLKQESAAVEAILLPLVDDVADNSHAISETKDSLQSVYNKISNINGDLATLNVLVERQLTSLVLKPDYYFGGIEAVEVPALKEVPTEKLADEKNALTINEAFQATNVTITKANQGVATYHVNPAVADLTGYSFDFYGNAPQTRAGKEFVSAVYKTYADAEKAGYGVNAGLIEVPFVLNNEEYQKAVAQNTTPMIALQASKTTTSGPRTVTSDYAMLHSTQYTTLILADNSLETDAQATISTLNKNQDLYGQGENQTVRALTTVNTAYSHIIGIEGQESLDLNEIVETHYLNENSKQAVMPAATFKNLGLQYQFDLVKNQRNNFKHTEGDYAVLENGVVSVNPDLKDVAAGHQPIVRVLLKDKDGNILKHGYIKLQISKFAYPISGNPYEETNSVTCDGVEFGKLYLDGLVNDLAKKNDMETTSYIQSVDLTHEGNTAELKQYYFKEDGSFAEVEAAKKIGTVTTSLGTDKLNTVVYPYNGGDRDNITWNLPTTVTDTIKVNAEGKNIYPLVTYVRVTNNNSLNSFIRLTIPAGSIVKPVATIKANSKVAARWYKENPEPGTDGQNGVGINDLTEIHINTVVPGVDPNDATITYNLDESFQGKTPKFELNEAFKEQTVTDWEYKFINKPGNGKWIVTGASGTQYEIKVAADGKSLTATTVGNVIGNGVRAADHTFATLSGTHNALVNIQTKNIDNQNRAVYDIINAYGHKDLQEGETFKAYIGVTATVQCQKADAGSFTARILRPIDLVAAGFNMDGADAIDGGAQVAVTSLFNNPTDWRGKWADNYWTYYGVDIDADVDNALTDAALPQAERKAYTAGSTDAEKIQTLGTVTNANLNFSKKGTGRTATLVYKNNGATIGDFHIYVPLTVTYYWGYKWNVGYARLDISKTIGQLAKRK